MSKNKEKDFIPLKKKGNEVVMIPTPKKIAEFKKEINDKIEQARTYKDLRILWFSVAPFINSGYGIVTKNMMARLLNKGMQGFIAAYYGIQPLGSINWKGMYVLPVSKMPSDPLGFNVAAEHYKRFRCDLGIFHSDFWVSAMFAKLIPNSLCFSPIDHESYPDKWLEVLRMYKWVAVPSLHAQAELKKSDIKSTFIPHGVDTKIYYPLDKTISRQAFTLEKDKFVIGIVAANNDDETRKGWDANFQAVKIFLDNNPDAKKDTVLFLHTDYKNPKGRNLLELNRQVGVDKCTIWNDLYTTSILSLPETAMAKLYNSFDVFLLLSRREGFCIPALEAQACGTPCILTNFSAMIERNNYGKCGWLVNPAAKIYSPLNAITAIPDPYKGAEALGEAYNNPAKLKMFSKRSVEYAKGQTWDIAVDRYMVPLLEKIWEEIRKPKEDPKGKKGEQKEWKEIAKKELK